MTDVRADLDAMRSLASDVGSSSFYYPTLGREHPATGSPRVDQELENLVLWLAYVCDAHRSGLAFLASGLSSAAAGYQRLDEAAAAGLARSAWMQAR